MISALQEYAISKVNYLFGKILKYSQNPEDVQEY